LADSVAKTSLVVYLQTILFVDLEKSSTYVDSII